MVPFCENFSVPHKGFFSADPHKSVLDLARRLIACRSITPNDGGALDLIQHILEEIGFSCERLDFQGVSNLWARYGTASPCIVFVGHVDVVPPGNEEKWISPPFEPSIVIDDHGIESLYGRGAVDMKSSLAAMIVAVKQLIAHTQLNGSIAFAVTSDEEGPALHGTAHLVKVLTERGEFPDYVLVGEPTSITVLGDTVKIGRRGSLSGHLTVFGKSGHVAYPERADNPIHRLIPALTELLTVQWDKGDAFFPPTTLQISYIHADAGALNVIPETVEVGFNIRFNPEQNPERLIDKIESIFSRHQLSFKIEWKIGALPFFTQPGKLFAALRTAICEVTGVEPKISTDGGTSDGRFFARLSSEIAEFGPVNATIHQVNEHIAVNDLEQLVAIYRHTLYNLIGKASE